MASTSSDEEARTQALQTRILTHMNADHANSLSLYLQHFCSVPAAQSKPATLESLTLSHMILTSPAGRNIIPLDPPMKSYVEARERMVALHRDALAGLDLSDITVNEWVAPGNVPQWAITLLCAWCYLTLSQPNAVLPGGWAYPVWSVGGLAPGLAGLAYKLANATLVFMLVAHGFETGSLMRTRLRRHAVPFAGGVWWAWMANTFFSGAGAIRRFDGLIKQKEMAGKKH